MPRSTSKNTDPFAGREAAKYENPIPSREFILSHLEGRPGPVSYRKLAKELSLADDESLEALRRRLNAMLRDGQIMVTRRGDFGVIDKMSLIRGRVQGHKDGYGFLIPEDGSDDLFINQRQMNTVFDGDRVLVRPSEYQHRGKNEAVIVEVLERAFTQLVGRFGQESGVAFMVPENPRINQDILIADDGRMGAKSGQMVIVEIESYPDKRKNAVGRVIEVLGEHMAPGMEIDVALHSHNIPFEWPDAVTASLASIAPEVDPKEVAKRVDLRDLPFVTIDGEDARDFDDAVYCEPLAEGGWKLYVAIADVSHYVTVGSPLDEEAYNRGTSVYFPEQVIPMLPELLSNGLCSLNPQVDRLTMVCEMTIDSDGEMLSYRFCEGVIYSHARLTYTKVAAMLQQATSATGQKLREQYANVVPHLEALYALYGALHRARQQRGAIDFETTEVRMVFGEDRKIDRIVPVHRNDAHKLIEECMLCANVAAADFLKEHKLVGLYRVHDKPSVEKLENLRNFLGELGLHLGGDLSPKAKDYQAVMQKIGERPDAHLIQTVMLRSMMQAVYSPDNLGHFGLAFDAYVHFTSPIRRYPDLLVHRAIRSVIRSRRKTGKAWRTEATRPMVRKTIYPYTPDQIDEFGEHCSMTERRADEAVRDVTDWLKCEYMQDRVGEEYVGVITGVTAFGLFIELQEIYVEGLLHVSALNNDYYQFDSANHRLEGEKTGYCYQLGDTVSVVVSRVDLDERKIDFDLSGDAPAPKKSMSRRKSGKHAQPRPDRKNKPGRRKPSKSKAASAEKKTKAKKPSTKARKAKKGKSVRARRKKG